MLSSYVNEQKELAGEPSVRFPKQKTRPHHATKLRNKGGFLPRCHLNLSLRQLRRNDTGYLCNGSSRIITCAIISSPGPTPDSSGTQLNGFVFFQNIFDYKVVNRLTVKSRLARIRTHGSNRDYRHYCDLQTGDFELLRRKYKTARKAPKGAFFVSRD